MKRILLALAAFLAAFPVMASEADLKIPQLNPDQNNLLMLGFIVCLLGLGFGLYQFMKVKKMRAHQSMLDVSHIIFETCKKNYQ